ncbi:MAG: hypothetical protein Q4C87_08050 [Actinomycetaceae bacterium]|nr:hypothetical protein [Actinomycetaceae bacterium]
MVMKAIDRLMTVLPQPEDPGIDPALLEGFRQEGVPEDLVDFLRVYGAGQVDGFVNMIMPGHPNKWTDSHRLTREYITGFRALEDLDSFELPPGLTSLDDLRAWGNTANGDKCFYVPPESGEVEYLLVIWSEWEWFVERTMVCDLLADWLDHKIAIPVFPDDIPLRYHTFTPFEYASAKRDLPEPGHWESRYEVEAVVGVEAIDRLSSCLPQPEDSAIDPVILAACRDEGVPEDFIELIRCFGPGQIDDFVNILVPGHPDDQVNAHKVMERWFASLSDLEAMDALEPKPYRWSDKTPVSELRAWAETYYGDMCFYAPPKEGETKYPIVILTNPARERCVYSEATICDFLADWLGRVDFVDFFPSDLPLETHTFQPYNGHYGSEK